MPLVSSCQFSALTQKSLTSNIHTQFALSNQRSQPKPLDKFLQAENCKIELPNLIKFKTSPSAKAPKSSLFKPFLTSIQPSPHGTIPSD